MTDSPNLQQQQHELLQGAQERMAAWMTRRHEALETGLDAMKRMSACKTPVEMAAIYGEWLSGSMTRVLADLQDGHAHTAKMADTMAEHFQKASKTLLASPQAALGEPAALAESPAPPQLREAA